MEDLAQPRREPTAAREKRTALLAAAAGLFLSVPLLALTLKRWKAVVPDQDVGFKPIAEISGRAHDTPRITLEVAKTEPIFASMISLPSRAPRMASPTLPPPARRAAPPAPAKKQTVSKIRKPAKKKAPAAAVERKKTPAPLPVAPPPFARPSDFYELEFPASPAPAGQTAKRAPPALEAVAVPDFADPPPTQKTSPRGPEIIIERVPNNDR